MVSDHEPRVAVIVLHWKDMEGTIRCLDCLDKSDYKNIETFVVNNGDGARAAGDFARRGSVTVVSNQVNHGYAGGNNDGLRLALDSQAEYFWLLNADVTVETDALGKLVAAMQADGGLGVVAPVVRYRNSGGIQAACGVIRPNGQKINVEDENGIRSMRLRKGDVYFVPGTAWLIRRSTIEKVGFLDEDLFAYYEDDDYCIRCARAGVRISIVPDATVFHDEDEERNPRHAQPYSAYYFSRNPVLLARKHRQPLRRRFLWPLRGVLAHLRSPGDKALAEAALAGLWDGWIGHGGAYDPSRRMPWPVAALVRLAVPLALHAVWALMLEQYVAGWDPVGLLALG
jgi:GT2 family glycosyltransferase